MRIMFSRKTNTKNEGKENPTNNNFGKPPTPLKDYFYFKWAAYIGIAAAFVVTGFITKSIYGQYEFCGSSLCWKTFFDIYSPPIKIATGTLLLLGLIGLVYRSTQTTEQMIHSNKIWDHELRQTAFSRYLEHNKMFIELLNRLEKEYKIRFLNKSGLYDAWFPDSKIHNFNISLGDSDKGPIGAYKKLKEASEVALSHAENCIFEMESVNAQYSLIQRSLANLGVDANSEAINFIGLIENKEIIQKKLEITYAVLNPLLKISDNKIELKEIDPDMLKIYKRAEYEYRNACTARNIKEDDKIVIIFGSASPPQGIKFDSKNFDIEIHQVSETELKNGATKELRAKLENNKEGQRDNMISA
ncbi:hypothetical protein ACJJIG_21115 [Microbulbifer sp. SSSA007]|uniref:hypothetical protein n=1 Tax=Microbulbifer sp. SSSA007 TaxID=3243379 RepID=UPI0040393711